MCVGGCANAHNTLREVEGVARVSYFLRDSLFGLLSCVALLQPTCDITCHIIRQSICMQPSCMLKSAVTERLSVSA